MSRIYLDWNATAPMRREALAAMTERLEPWAISTMARTIPASARLEARSVTKERSILSDVIGKLFR